MPTIKRLHNAHCIDTRAPEMFVFYNLCYLETTFLFYGDDMHIMSLAHGMQGEAASMCFSIGFHEILKTLASNWQLPI